MWARNSSRDAERAQDDADFGAAPGGGNRFPEDDTGHVTFRAATEGVGPIAGDPNFRQSLTDAIAGLYLGDGNLDKGTRQANPRTDNQQSSSKSKRKTAYVCAPNKPSRQNKLAAKRF